MLVHTELLISNLSLNNSDSKTLLFNDFFCIIQILISHNTGYTVIHHIHNN